MLKDFLSRTLFIIGFSVILIACSESTPVIDEIPPLTTELPIQVPPTSEPDFKFVKSSNERDNISSATLNFIRILIDEIDIPVAQYDVKPIDLIYSTKNPWTNQNIDASGVLLVPNTDKEVPIISLHHGTIEPGETAPSKQLLGFNEITVAIYFASLGFIVSFPDYIGYGESKQVHHPYEHLNSLGSSSHDMLIAAKEYLEIKSINHTNELFLVGYSEGATSSIGHAKLVQENSGFELLGLFVGGGAYDKTQFFEILSTKDEQIQSIPNYIWALNTINELGKGLKRSWSSYVNPPYDKMLENLKEINGLISKDLVDLNPQNLFNTAFRDGVLEGTDVDFISVLEENSIQSIDITVPISFYYVPDDSVTFSDLISKSVYMKQISKQTKNRLIELDAENHFEGGTVFFFETYHDIKTLLESQ
ncbi:MAG: hypothetical protein OXC03_07515 [Flavobacteriaceae bacterium]|nr:hypothetical protein [Flavobacteriaceae bacterium]